MPNILTKKITLLVLAIFTMGLFSSFADVPDGPPPPPPSHHHHHDNPPPPPEQ